MTDDPVYEKLSQAARAFALAHQTAPTGPGPDDLHVHVEGVHVIFRTQGPDIRIRAYPQHDPDPKFPTETVAGSSSVDGVVAVAERLLAEAAAESAQD